MKNLIVVFLSSFIVFSIPVKANELFTFEVGKYWKYSVQASDTYEVVNHIEKSKIINGKKWYQLIEYGEKFWVSNSPKGQVEAVNLYETQGEYTGDLEVSLIFKYPAKVGEQWGMPENLVIYNGLKSISVPAGKFNCHMYHMDLGGNNYSDTCIAEGVGVIYNESILNDGDKEISRLVEYGKH